MEPGGQQRSERYWYAYLRTGHKLCKKYLGKTADLTLARLEEESQNLCQNYVENAETRD